jgi:outer membrane protein TolC
MGRFVSIPQPRLRIPLLCFSLVIAGCASSPSREVRQFPPLPTYPPDHRYSLDELIALSIHRNASLDVVRYEAEAVQGLVDQVKALWLPTVQYGFAAIAYDNDLNYKARALEIVSLNVPITGTYNIINSAVFAQIVSTGGKRTSGLKQAKMYAAIKKLEILRQQDAVASDVAKLYHLVCLTSDLDSVIEDTVRRIRVFRQVAQNLNQRGSLRGNNLDALQADFVVTELEQLRIALQAGRQQAYEALKHYAGVGRDEPLLLRQASLAPPITAQEALSVYAQIVRGFFNRPELQQVDLFTGIRREQVKFAKAAWAPNVAIAGTYTDTQGSLHTILEQVDGLIVSALVTVPIYDPARRGRLREALGLEQASLAFQRQVEELITLEIEVTGVDCQRALAILLKCAHARQIAAEHYDATRQAFTRELVPASDVVAATVIDMLAKAQYLQAVFAYHDARARLKRVTADRESEYGS